MRRRERTQVNEDACLALEDDVEVPASSERADGALNTERLPADDLDLHWPVLAFGVCARYAATLVSHPRSEPTKRDAPRGRQVLVCWVDHLVLLRKIDPQLETARLGQTRFLDGHLRV
jgi:hypothetical protein